MGHLSGIKLVPNQARHSFLNIRLKRKNWLPPARKLNGFYGVIFNEHIGGPARAETRKIKPAVRKAKGGHDGFEKPP